MDIGLLDHCRQRLLGQPPRLEEAREVGAAPQLRDPQLDRTRPGLPIALAVAIALHQPIGAELAMGGAGDRAHLQLHQPLGRETDHLAQEGSVRRLLQQPAKGHRLVGHRGRLKVWGCWSQQPNPTRDHRGDRRGRRCGQGARRSLTHSSVAPGGYFPTAPTPHPGTRPWEEPGNESLWRIGRRPRLMAAVMRRLAVQPIPTNRNGKRSMLPLVRRGTRRSGGLRRGQHPASSAQCRSNARSGRAPRSRRGRQSAGLATCQMFQISRAS